MARTDFWLYEGEPTEEEIQAHIEWGNTQLGYKLTCPDCGRSNTHFLRNTYWMCHNCGIWFETYYKDDDQDWLNKIKEI